MVTTAGRADSRPMRVRIMLAVALAALCSVGATSGAYKGLDVTIVTTDFGVRR